MRERAAPSGRIEAMASATHGEPALPAYGERPEWGVVRPRFRLFRLLLAWAVSAAALLGAARIIPGAHVHDYRSALAAAAVIAVLNAILPPIVAAVRLPFVALLGFLVVLVLYALMLLAADHITNGDLA